MHKVQSKGRRICLLLLGIIAVLLFGGLFAVGYLLYRDQHDDRIGAEYLISGNQTLNQSLADTSWLESDCNDDLYLSDCEARGFRGIPPLVIISLDGFAARYIEKHVTPVLEKLKSCGAHSSALRSSFPSITFPNHYSIATGLHLESHGIIDNKFFDPDLRRSFNYKEGDAGPNADPVWWKGEPLWVTAKKQGKIVHTYYWPGNEVLIKGYRADEWFHYNHEDTFDDRLARILDRLSRPQETRPNLIMLYYDEPDAKGHIYGVNTPEVTAAIREVDASIDRFMQGLYDKNLTNCVNVIVLSDHGMEDALCNKSVALMSVLNSTQRDGRKTGSNDFITDEDFVVRGHTEGGIDSRSSNVSLDTLYKALSCGPVLPWNSSTSTAVPFLLFKKEDLPRRLHYTNSNRIEPLILNVKPSYTVFQTADPTNFCFGGRHGYDPILDSMTAVFVAHGPAFKSGVQIQSFSNVELYNLFCELLALEPAPNNGTNGALHSILKKPKTMPEPAKVRTQYPPNLPMNAADVRRRQSDYCLLSCKEITGRVIPADMRLVLSKDEQQALLTQHTYPYGPPEAPRNATVTTLVNSIYALGFSHDSRLPIWAALHVNTSMLDAANYFDVNFTCARNDVRLSSLSTLSCADFESDAYSAKIVPSYLVSPGFGKTRIHKTEGTVITNIIPMYASFRRGVWVAFWRMIARWSNATGEHLHVQLGPVFDHELPYGLPDLTYRMAGSFLNNNVPLPSHFFVIISRQTEAVESTNEAIAFILPHREEKLHSCQTDEEYFLDNTATIKDVELLTGLRFFTDFSFYDAVKLRTYQPTKLWFS